MDEIYETIFKPLFFHLDPETAHNLVVSAMKASDKIPYAKALLSKNLLVADPRLEIQIFGRRLANPVGIGAGFDKNCELTRILPAFGFGFLECGTVTRYGQPGNAKPRIFRFPESEALINRLGFNNQGCDLVQKRLNGQKFPLMLGLNIGKSKVTPLEEAASDYVYSFEKLYDFADYFVINVSSPNTARLRELQQDLTPLLSAIQSKNSQLANSKSIAPRPVFVKTAPDLDLNALEAIADCCLTFRIAGIIATNTTVSRTGINLAETIEGGLSGRPLFDQSTEILRHLRRQTKGQLMLVGVGGIFSAEDAYKKIKAGASLVQVYTGWIYRGPKLIPSINRGLIELLTRDGFANIKDAVGVES